MLKSSTRARESGRHAPPASRIEVDGCDLILQASAAPLPAVLDLLSRHKAGIVTAASPGR